MTTLPLPLDQPLERTWFYTFINLAYFATGKEGVKIDAAA